MTIFGKHFILDVWQGSEYASGLFKLFCRGSKRDTQEGWYMPNWLSYSLRTSPQNLPRPSAIVEGFAKVNSVFIVITSAIILPRWLFSRKIYIQFTVFDTYFSTKLSSTNKRYHMHVLEKCLNMLQEVRSITYVRQLIHLLSLMFLNSFFRLIFFRSRKDATESRIHAQMFS